MKSYRANHAVNIVTIVLFMLGFSFRFNFLRESLHAVYLYQRHIPDALNYVPMMLHGSTVDGLMALGFYLCAGLCGLNILWIKSCTERHIAAFSAIGIVAAAVFEYRAVFYSHKWLCKEATPTLFGRGVSAGCQF